MSTPEFKNYLEQKSFSRISIETRLGVISRYFEWLEKEALEAEAITYNDLLLYIKHSQRKGVSQRTVQNYLGTVKLYYDHLIRENKVAINPAADIKVQGVKRKVMYHILEPQELHQIYNAQKSESLADRRNKVMLGLLVYQGLKTEELRKLETGHIKLREGQIEVPGGRKSNHRKMTLESHQVMDMYDYVLQTRPLILGMEPKRKSQTKVETDQLFIGEGGNCYSLSNFMTQLMIKVRKIHPSVLNAKQIRASVITKWVKTQNLRKAQYLAGHRYISATESYLQNDLEGLKEEVQQFHPLG